MGADILVEKLVRIRDRSSASERTERLQRLLLRPTEIDRPNRWLGRGKVYFHALQDVRFVAQDEPIQDIQESQGCFAQDLSCYLEYFPGGEPQMRSVFQVILDSGVSDTWEKNLPLVRELNEIYTGLDRALIRPWANRL